jgi:hypothetical protein
VRISPSATVLRSDTAQVSNAQTMFPDVALKSCDRSRFGDVLVQFQESATKDSGTNYVSVLTVFFQHPPAIRHKVLFPKTQGPVRILAKSCKIYPS